MIKPIKTAADHEAALAEIDRLGAKNPAAGSDDGNRLEVLATLAEAYEKIHYPNDPPTPLEAIEFEMHRLGLKPKDLVPHIGSRSKVSEVLSGKRSLSLSMIRALSKAFDIPADILIQKTPKAVPKEVNIEWSRFPIAEMMLEKWLPERADVGGREEDIMRDYLEPVGGVELVTPLYRRQLEFSERSGRRMDVYALVAWSARILLLAKKQSIAEYVPGTVNAEFMQDVVRCSWSAQGPLLAQELLANSGVHLVIEKHLRRTYLDGSACLMPKTGAPVIGMTIRHDRIDNFWFVLLHELAHVAVHLDKPDAPRKSFFDDLEAEAQGDDEKEADALAAEALIPADAWAGFVSSPMTPGSIAKFANSLTIHPAIVAGRYRHKAKNYKRFSRMVGRNNVRKLFEDVDWPR